LFILETAKIKSVEKPLIKSVENVG